MTLSARELSLLSNTDVLGYIRQQNAERDAQAKAEGWDAWSLMCESLAGKYSNVYELELMFAQCVYSDVYKDARYGRPGFDYSGYTLEELEAEIEDLQAEAEANWKQEELWRAEEARLHREAIAMGLEEPTEEIELEEWEVWEAKAEQAGY